MIRLVVCPDCEGDPIDRTGGCCETCGGECVIHTEVKPGYIVVPCDCPRCSEIDAAVKPEESSCTKSAQ